MSNARRSLPTRLLHLALLLSVLWQLIGSNFVDRPRPDRPGNWSYQVHQVVGLVTLGLVLAFWLWALVRRRDTPIGTLFPWFSARRRAALAADIRMHWNQLRQWRLPESPIEAPLASAVHGLGLLTVLAMAASGAWLYTMSIPDGLPLQFHELASNLLWAYLTGHAGLAVVHQLCGHRVLQRIFANASTR